MRRSLTVLLVLLTTVAAGCGGGSSSSTSNGGSGDGSAAGLLSSIKGHSGPAHQTLDLKVTLDGTPSGAAGLGALLAQPIELKVDGTSGGGSGASDVDLTVSAGALNITAKVLTDGKSSWIQYGTEWYVLDVASLAGAASGIGGGGASSVASDPSGAASKVRDAFADPASFLKDARVVGDEKAAGVASTHITGTIDVVKLVEVIGKAVGSAVTAPTADEQAKIDKALRTATVDVWVGKSDNELHRLTVTIDLDVAALDSSQTSGVKGAKIALDLTTAGADEPKVEAPANPKPAAELFQAIFGALGPALGGGTVTG